jgi:pimeloyl-ACP methyl ester carboxylesterase
MDRDAFLDLHPDDPQWGHGFGSGAAGVRLHYVRQGRGPATILLHGWPGFWYDWRRVVPRLTAVADVIAPDFRGFGDSDKPDLPPLPAYAPRTLATDILALMNHLGIERAHLVAHDIGAVVAQEMARTVPERIVALILLNPPYPGIGERRSEPAAQREAWCEHFHNLPLAEYLVGYNRDTIRLYLAHLYGHWLGRKDTLRPAEFEALVDVCARPGAFAAGLACCRARAAIHAHEVDLANQTALRVRQPTHILWGEADPVMPIAWSDRLPEFFAQWSYRALPDIGHFVPFEAPDEVVAAVTESLADFGREDT